MHLLPIWYNSSGEPHADATTPAFQLRESTGEKRDNHDILLPIVTETVLDRIGIEANRLFDIEACSGHCRPTVS
jgi:hypothetical protein